MTRDALDPVEIARELIRCPSVTPIDAGALDRLQARLESLGFHCHRLPFSEPGSAEVDNLYARLGKAGETFCYAGHTDVVPVGDPGDWSVDPFGAELRDGRLYGRGTVDMKGSIGAFVAAASGFLARRGPDFGGSLCFLITGDEEAEAINGTRKVLGWMAEQGERIDACLVGEPTSGETIGDTVKIGRRGSLNGRLTVNGVQGHTAYPQHADNPAHRLVAMLQAVTGEPLDEGSAHFEPSSLQITSIDIGNKATNVIPAQAQAAFNVRFNDLHDSAAVERWLRERLDRAFGPVAGAGPGAEPGADYRLDIRVSGESFLTPPGRLSEAIAGAVKGVAGIETALGTGGGTSDARFIKDLCPVAELGLRNATAHKVDEHAELDELHALTAIYEAVLDRFFAP